MNHSTNPAHAGDDGPFLFQHGSFPLLKSSSATGSQLSPSSAPSAPAAKACSDRQILYDFLNFMLDTLPQRQAKGLPASLTGSPPSTSTPIRHDTFLYSVRPSQLARQGADTEHSESQAGRHSPSTIHFSEVPPLLYQCKTPSRGQRIHQVGHSLAKRSVHGLQSPSQKSELPQPPPHRVDSSHYSVPEFARSSSNATSISSPESTTYLDGKPDRGQKGTARIPPNFDKPGVLWPAPSPSLGKSKLRRHIPRLLSIYDSDCKSSSSDDSHIAENLVAPSSSHALGVDQSLYMPHIAADEHVRQPSAPSPTPVPITGGRASSRVSRPDEQEGPDNDVPRTRRLACGWDTGNILQPHQFPIAAAAQPRSLIMKQGITSPAGNFGATAERDTVKGRLQDSDSLEMDVQVARKEKRQAGPALRNTILQSTTKRTCASMTAASSSGSLRQEGNSRVKRLKIAQKTTSQAINRSNLSCKAADQILCALHHRATCPVSSVSGPVQLSARSLRAQERAHKILGIGKGLCSASQADSSNAIASREAIAVSASSLMPTEMYGDSQTGKAMQSGAAVDTVLATPFEATQNEDTASMTLRQAAKEERHLPQHVERLPDRFPGFYQQYALPSQLLEPLRSVVFPGGTRSPTLSPALRSVALRAFANVVGDPNPASIDPFSLYVPRYTRGSGLKKEGLCPICYDASPLGQACVPANWYYTKMSAYNYHMQISHGIMPSTGQPMDPPTAFKTIERAGTVPAGERKKFLQGRCHACAKWIALESIKDLNVKIPEIYWRKHAAKCHKNRRMPATGKVFVEDEFYRHVKAACEDESRSASAVGKDTL